MEVEAVDGSSQVLQAMSAGQAQIGAPGPGPVLGARARGLDVSSSLTSTRRAFSVFWYEENPISTRPPTCAARSSASGTADGAEVSFARAILTRERDDGGRQTYTFLPVGDGGTAAVAFLRDDVDRLCGCCQRCGDPCQSRAQPARDHSGQYLAFFGNGIAALQSYMDENPAVIEGFGTRAGARNALPCRIRPTRKRRWRIWLPATRRKAKTAPSRRRCWQPWSNG